MITFEKRKDAQSSPEKLEDQITTKENDSQKTSTSLTGEFTLIVPQHLTINEYQKIYRDYAQQKTLKKFTLISAPFNTLLLNDFCNCLCSNPLLELNLTGTTFTAQMFDQILEALANHPTIKKVNLRQCNLTQNSLTALANFVAKSRTLESLDISDHYFKNEASLIDAIQKSSSLVQINGLKNSEPIENHLQQNRYFQQLEAMVSAEAFGDRQSKIDLNIKKKLFYRTFNIIHKSSHDKRRLEALLLRFYLLLANEYQRLEDNENVDYYYKKIFRYEKHKDIQYQAHQAYGEFLYGRFSSLHEKAAPAPSAPKESVECSTSPALLLVGFKAFKHLNKALVYSSKAAEKERTQHLLNYLNISLGETLLEEADKKESGFRKKYQRKSES